MRLLNAINVCFQITFDAFTVGKFVSFTENGCPHGHMSIIEQGLPDTGGQWCGSAWGYTVYFSETRSINMTLALTRLSEQVRSLEICKYCFKGHLINMG